MAEELTTGVFTEQLKLTVDTGDLERGLDEARKAWENFKKGLGADAGNVFQGTALTGLANSIEATSKTLRDLSNEVLANNAILVRKLGGFVDQQVHDVQAGENEKVEAAKKTAEFIARLADKDVPGIAPTGNVPPGTGRDIINEHKGILDAKEQADEAYAKRALLRDADVANRADETAAKQVEKRKSENEQLHKSRINSAREINTVIQGVEDKFAVDQEKRAQKAFQREADFANKADAEAEKKRAADELATRQHLLRTTEQLHNLSQGREASLFRRELLDAESLIAQLDIIKRRLVTLQGRHGRLVDLEGEATAGGDKDAQVRASTALLKVEKEIEAVLNKRNSTLDKISSKTKQIENTNRKLAQHAAKIAAQAEKADTFFSRLTDGEKWSSTLAHLFRFYILWNGVQAVIQGVGEAFKAPFQLLGVGVKYLQDTERAADDLVGVIATNMKFSDNYAENFKIAQKASVEVTEALQDQAILTGFSADALEKTFSALAESGATKYVRTLNEMVELATDFQLALKAAGAGGLAAQTSVQEMVKLFSGNPSKDNKFLAWLGVNPAEWDKMRKAAVDTRDLTVRIAEKSQAFRDALVEAGQGQVVVIGNLKLLLSKIAGEGAKPLFAELTKALREITTWLNNNKVVVTTFMRALANGAIDILERLKAAFSDPKVLDGFLTTFLFIEQIVGRMVTSIGNLFRTVQEYAEKGPVQVTIDIVKRKSIELGAEALGKAAANKTIREKFKKELDAADRAGIEDAVLDLHKEEFEALWRANAAALVEAAQKSSKDPFFTGKSFNEPIAAAVARNKAKAEADIASLVKGKPTLGLGFDSGVDRNQKEDILEKINADFRLAEEVYRASTDRIKQAISKRKDTLDDALAAGTISQATFAEKAIGLDSEQQAATFSKFTEFMEKIGALRTRVEGLAGKDPNKVEALNKQFNTLALKAIHDRVDAEYQAGRKIQAINLDVTKETESIRVAEAAFEITLLKNKLALEEQLIKSAEEAGILTELAAFDAIQVAKKEGFDLEVKQRNLNLEGAQQNAAKVAEIRRDIRLADQKREDEIKIAGNQRIALVVKEQRASAELAHIKLQQAIQEKESVITREGLLNPTKNLLVLERELLALKEQDLAARKLIADEELKAAQAAGGGKKTDRVIKATEAAGIIAGEAIKLSVDKIAAELAGMTGPLRDVRARRLDTEPLGLSTGQALADALFGKNFADEWSSTKGPLGKFGLGLIGAAAALEQFSGIIGNIRRGTQEGGTLGGIGAGVSAAGSFATLLKGDGEKGFGKLMAQLGPYAQAAGAVLSIIGSLFTSAARRIGESIKKSLEATMTSFNREQSTLVATIAEIERLRTDAITRLSGKKGGQSELDKLLPGIDDQLFSLKKQQTDILENFDDNLSALRTNSSVLTDVKKKWQDINKQVKDYLGAGGDAAKAAEMLSLELAQIRLSAVEELNDAEQSAIQSIRTLNGLLEQRNDLIEDFKQKEFDIITADALDRRQAGSVIRGKELTDLRTAHEKALADLDSEIVMAQVKVDKEQTVFNLVNETSALRRRDEELTLIALDAQIQKWRDLQTIVAGITLGPGGFVGSGVTAPVTINVTVAAPPTGDPDGWARGIGDSIANAYIDRLRSVPS